MACIILTKDDYNFHRILQSIFIITRHCYKILHTVTLYYLLKHMSHLCLHVSKKRSITPITVDIPVYNAGKRVAPPTMKQLYWIIML